MVKPVGHYVYGIKVSRVLRYIGKGSGYRAWDHIRRPNTNRLRTNVPKIAEAINRGAKVNVVILADDLTHREAIAYEDTLIRKHQKTLWNKPVSVTMLKLWEDPKFREKRAKALALAQNNPGYWDNVRAGLKAAHKLNPAMQAGLAKGRTKQARRRQGQSLSIGHADRMRDPDYRKWYYDMRSQAAAKAWETKRRKQAER